MSKQLFLMLAAALALSACVSSGSAQLDPTPGATDIFNREVVRVTPEPITTATPEPTATVEAVVPTHTPQPTATSTPEQPSEPTPTRVSEVLPADEPPPVRVSGGTVLPMPANIAVLWSGCASDGECHWYNFYWAPTHEVVMQPGEGEHKVWHERCHAHQHWSINGGESLPPSDYDLESWYQTSEGLSFTSAVASLAWPWTHSAQSGLEDFAWTCGYWYYDPAYLLAVSPARYDWAAANLP